jgi:hypothetical protein
MKTVRPTSAWAFVLGLVFALLAPPAALGQRVRAFDGVPAPKSAVTVELVNVRTREAQTMSVFPGFSGGVRVAAGA